MAAKRVHKVVLRVTFDKPVTTAFAVHEVGDCIHGDFYPTPVFGKRGFNAEKFVVRSASRLPTSRGLR
jgi:hypothetical protein